jgi:hypothetical protein
LPPTDRFAAWLRRGLPPVALAVGLLGIVAAWTGLHMVLQSPVAWMAPVAALDMAWMLRFSGARPGRARAAVAVSATAIAIAATIHRLAATQMARLIGLTPMESAQRLGPVLFGELVRHGTDGWDVALLLVALPLAWRLAR